jgi:hypothetical protein
MMAPRRRLSVSKSGGGSRIDGILAGPPGAPVESAASPISAKESLSPRL